MEDVEHKTIAISLKASKLTAQAMAKAFQAVLRKIQKEQSKKANQPQGRQSVKRLTRRFDAKTIPLNGATRLFDRVIKEKHLKVDYAFMQTGPKKHILFFKAAQADEITAAFAEYTKRVIRKERQPSVRGQMRQAADIARKRPHEREHRREAVHGDR